MKTILIPTDFSNNAYCALYYATQLFAEEKCTFIIVHSFENQVTNLTSRIDIGKTEAVVDELYNTCESNCDEVKHKIILDTNNNKHCYKTIATSLSLSRAINKLIAKEQVDFVVMGSKGSTGASDILVGSNTLAMIRKIKKKPLLVVPQEFDFKPIKKIAFATGFKRAYTKNELQPLLDISSISNTGIKVIHVHKNKKKSDLQRANSHQLFKLLEKGNPKNNWLPGETDTYDAITSFLKKEQIDLLAMIYYKHNAIVRLFREATVKDIAKYTGIPFLIMPTLD
ncbi:universal stress protein [Rasiella sp. SM2506]|uniref:universal stress protein n=1 Tax=Rasiella sp. SM2506 TaxID=3423914 RepID=UPI003D791C7C